MFAVVVTLQVKDGQMPEFLPAMMENARASLAEPACQRFDVCTDPDRPNEVFLYEIYDDAAGFDAHLQTSHFKTFDAFAGPLLSAKELRTYQTVAG